MGANLVELGVIVGATILVVNFVVPGMYYRLDDKDKIPGFAKSVISWAGNLIEDLKNIFKGR